MSALSRMTKDDLQEWEIISKMAANTKDCLC